MPDTSLPGGLIQVLADKAAIIFFGSGLSVDAGLPTGNSLAQALNDKLPYGSKVRETTLRLEEIAERYELEFGRASLANEIENHVVTTGVVDISPVHFLLATLVKHGFVSRLITTNYDSLFEDACRSLGVALKVVVHPSQLHYLGASTPVLIKLHGDFHHPDLLVMTGKDYNEFMSHPLREPLITAVVGLSQVHPFLYLGYSLRDSNLLQLLQRTRPSLTHTLSRKNYIAVHDASELATESARTSQYSVTAFAATNLAAALYELFTQLQVKLRILHLLFAYPNRFQPADIQFGGIETFVRVLREHSRHDHVLLPVFDENAFLFADRLHQQRLQRLQLTYPASFFYHNAACSASLHSILAAKRVGEPTPDVIHAHFVAFALQAEKAGFPTLCTSHSLLSTDLAFARGVFDTTSSKGAFYELAAAREAEHEGARNLETITVLSDSHAREIESLGASTVLRMQAPFDTAPFVARTATPLEERTSMRMRPEFTIGFVGRADRRKGIEILLDACKRLVTHDLGFQILLVSHGIYLDTQQKFLDFGLGRFRVDIGPLLGAGIVITLSPSTNDPTRIAHYYQAADVIVIPSLYEPMGYVALEAMASGRPILAARTGGLKELIAHDQTGVLFDAADAEDLAFQLQRLKNDEALRTRLAAAALSTLRSFPALPDVTKQWDRLYVQVALRFGQGRKQLPSDAAQGVAIEEILSKGLAQLPKMSIFDAVYLGCSIATEIVSVRARTRQPSEPVDREVFRFVANRLHEALRKQARALAVPTDALCGMMVDLALAYLNAHDQDRPAIPLSASSSKQRFDQGLEQSLNLPPLPAA